LQKARAYQKSHETFEGVVQVGFFKIFKKEQFIKKKILSCGKIFKYSKKCEWWKLEKIFTFTFSDENSKLDNLLDWDINFSKYRCVHIRIS